MILSIAISYVVNFQFHLTFRFLSFAAAPHTAPVGFSCYSSCLALDNIIPCVHRILIKLVTVLYGMLPWHPYLLVFFRVASECPKTPEILPYGCG